MRAAVATLLSQLTKQPLHGPRILLLLNRLLPPGLVTAIEVELCTVVISVQLRLLNSEVLCVSLGRISKPIMSLESFALMRAV